MDSIIVRNQHSGQTIVKPPSKRKKRQDHRFSGILPHSYTVISVPS